MKVVRLKEIESFMQQKQTATLPELCEKFNVSLNTIRRDINALCDSGVLTKVYGGVVLNDDNRIIPFNMRSDSELNEKATIGWLASAFLENNEIIYVDSGSTTVHLLKYIREDMNITIISNSLTVYMEAQKYPYINMISLSGLLNHKTNSFVGMTAINNLREYRINKAFMGASGIILPSGAANNSYHESEIKKTVIKQSSKIILMADSTKMGKSAAICFCDLNNADVIVTDKAPPKEYIRSFKECEIELIYQK